MNKGKEERLNKVYLHFYWTENNSIVVSKLDSIFLVLYWDQ